MRATKSTPLGPRCRPGKPRAAITSQSRSASVAQIVTVRRPSQGKPLSPTELKTPSSNLSYRTTRRSGTGSAPMTRRPKLRSTTSNTARMMTNATPSAKMNCIVHDNSPRLSRNRQ